MGFGILPEVFSRESFQVIFFLGKCMGTSWLESFFARVGQVSQVTKGRNTEAIAYGP